MRKSKFLLNIDWKIENFKKMDYSEVHSNIWSNKYLKLNFQSQFEIYGKHSQRGYFGNFMLG